ncbi:MAG: F0F1 ATP synthase subunit epsilon [Sphingomonadales bacterium]
MADTVTFDLVSPERLLRSSAVHMVGVPGTEGDFGVLAHHAPFMSTLRPGAVDIYESDGAQPEKLFVSGGFAEVADNRLTILAEDAVALADVNVDDVKSQLADAKEDLGDAKDDVERATRTQKVEHLSALIGLLEG